VHWQLASDFRRRHPKVDLHPDVLFIDDGDILTSAGSAAALDLALHIVRLDHGAQTANFVSRRLVFSAFRDGGMANRRARRPGAPSHPSTAPASRVISPSCRAVAENALLDANRQPIPVPGHPAAARQHQAGAAAAVTIAG
jgi:transcriptional regulator GlxA family with amidase domain